MNRGAARARSGILVFSDANAFYNPGALRALVSNFNDPDVGLVSGRKTVWKGRGAVPDSEAVYWSFDSWIRLNESRAWSSAAAVGEILAIRRSAFEPVPGWVVNDDAFLALQATTKGWRVVYEPAAVAFETGAETLEEELDRRARMTGGRWGLMCAVRWWPWRNPWLIAVWVSHKFLRVLLPFFLAGMFAANTALAWTPSASPIVRAAWVAQAGFYLLGMLGLATRSRARLMKPAALAGYFLLGQAATVIGALTFLSGRVKPVWKPARRTTKAGTP